MVINLFLKFISYFICIYFMLCKIYSIKFNIYFLSKYLLIFLLVNLIFPVSNLFITLLISLLFVLLKVEFDIKLSKLILLSFFLFLITYVVNGFISSQIVGFISYLLFNNETPTFVDYRIMEFLTFLLIFNYFSKDKYRNGINIPNRIQNIEKKITWILITVIIIVSISMILWDIVYVNNDNVILTKDYLYLSLTLNIFLISFYITTLFKHNFKLRANEQSINNLQEQITEQNLQIERFTKTSKLSHDTNHKLDVIIDKLSNMKQKDILEELTKLRSTYRSEMNHINNKILLQATNIEKIDNVLYYMFKECERNDINFLLKINGSVNYMIKHYISVDELTTLLSDHIKNAIISINNSDNTFKSILITIGEIGDYYGVVIFDSGKEFKINTLVNLGIKPATTYKNNGGTGIGFITTFDTLKKTNASLIIKELPSVENNYTKSITVQFDNFNDYKIISHRVKEIRLKNRKNHIHFENLN